MDPQVGNVRDYVPNLRGGLSETTKWILMFIIAVIGLLSGPLTTLIRAPRADDWTLEGKELNALREEVHLLKQAQDNHINVEAEVQKRRDLEYNDLRQLIQKVKR